MPPGRSSPTAHAFSLPLSLAPIITWKTGSLCRLARVREYESIYFGRRASLRHNFFFLRRRPPSCIRLVILWASSCSCYRRLLFQAGSQQDVAYSHRIPEIATPPSQSITSTRHLVAARNSFTAAALEMIIGSRPWNSVRHPAVNLSTESWQDHPPKT